MRHPTSIAVLLTGLLISPLSDAQIDWDPEKDARTEERTGMVWASAESPPRIPPWGQPYFILYRNTWYSALNAMTRYFSLDADGDEPSHDWDDHCDQVLVGLVDLLGQLQDAAPGDAGLSSEVTDWIADETEAVSQLCEHGSTAAIVFYQLEEETEWLQESTGHAAKSWNTLVDNVEFAATLIEDIDDTLAEVEPILSKARMGRTLTDAERSELAQFQVEEDARHVYPTEISLLENTVKAGGRRESAYSDYLDWLEEREEVYDDLIAGLPASLTGSRGTAGLYEKFIKEVLQRRETFTRSVDDLEEVTLPLRTGEFGSEVRLPLGIKSFDDLSTRYEELARRWAAAVQQAREVLSS